MREKTKTNTKRQKGKGIEREREKIKNIKENICPIISPLTSKLDQGK